MPRFRIALFTVLATALLAAAPTALAGKPGGGGHGGGGGASGSSCTQKTPGVSIDNTWGWAQWGSWGLAGQQLTYAINILNYDIGCASSSFVISISAPSGFSVSIPTNAITLQSSSSGYVWANVTSPSVVSDGDYPLTVTAARTSGPSGSATSSYKVYSTDTTAPILYWPNPADGITISGNSYQFIVSSSDDHAVRKIELYIDNVYTSTTLCDDIAYECQLVYKGSAGARGQHTATFKSYDWKGNVGVLTSTYTVS
jgi:hypothetical protein